MTVTISALYAFAPASTSKVVPSNSKAFSPWIVVVPVAVKTKLFVLLVIPKNPVAPLIPVAPCPPEGPVGPVTPVAP